MAGFYHNNKRRACQDGNEIAFTLAELGDFAALHALDQPCVYCGVTLDIDNLSLDHILPVSRGGNYFLTNMRGCCKRCNQIKGMMDEPELRNCFGSSRSGLQGWQTPS